MSMSNRYYHGEFHRSAHDNPTRYDNSRHLGNDITGSMRGILDHSEALPPPKARPRDGGNMLGALNHDAPVEAVPTVRHRAAAATPTGAEAGRLGLAGTSEMAALLTHGMAPVQQAHRPRNGGSMAALMAGEEPPPPAAGSSEAINSKLLLMDMPSSGRARGRPVAAAADPRESAMHRLQLGYREVLKLLQMPASPSMPNPRERDGSITADAARAILTKLDGCGVHVGPQSAGALLALCDVREQPSWDEFVYALAADQQQPPPEAPAEAPAAAPPPSGLQPGLQPEAERPLATLQPAGVNTEHSIALSGAQQAQSTWRRQQQQQFEEQQAGARPHPPAQCAAQSEWGRSTSREDGAPPSLTPDQIRAQVEAARGPQARGNWTNSKMVGQEANHGMARLLNGGDAHRHARSSQLAATAQTGTWNSWSR